MKIEKIVKRENLIYFVFEDEYGLEILDKILQYISSVNMRYYYLVFGDFMDGYDLYDLYIYKDKYPLLREEEGFFQLQEEDIHNVDLIYNTLNSYHSARLYINNDPDFLLGLKEGAWRRLPFSGSGYAVDMLIYYIDIYKNDELPAWDLSKIGIEDLPEPTPPTLRKEGVFSHLWRILRGW